MPTQTDQLSPPDSSINIDIKPDLIWFKSDRADNYRLQISKQKDFSVVDILDSNNITDTLIYLNSSTLSSETNYYRRVIAMNNYGTGKWSDTWTFRTKRMTTLDEHENYNVFKIFPNPVEEEFYIKFKSELETDINIRIYDLLGNLVYQNNCISNNGWF